MRLLFLLFLLPAAMAQEACTADDPCTWEMDIDETGLVGDREWNATSGDWMQFRVANLDDLPHDVRVDELDIAFSAYPFDDTDDGLTTHGPFQVLDGSYQLVAAGDHGAIFVAPAPEPAEGERAAGAPGADAPDAEETEAVAPDPEEPTDPTEGFVAWTGQGQPSHPERGAGPEQAPPGPSNGPETIQVPAAPWFFALLGMVLLARRLS